MDLFPDPDFIFRTFAKVVIQDISKIRQADGDIQTIRTTNKHLKASFGQFL